MVKHILNEIIRYMQPVFLFWFRLKWKKRNPNSGMRPENVFNSNFVSIGSYLMGLYA